MDGCLNNGKPCEQMDDLGGKKKRCWVQHSNGAGPERCVKTRPISVWGTPPQFLLISAQGYGHFEG